MRSYVRTVLVVLATALTLVVTWNSLVDPFGVWPTPEIDGFNSPKTEVSQRSRLYRAHAVRWRRPTGAIFGTSTSIIGLDPAHPGWNTPRVHNMALPGANMYQVRRYLEHAVAAAPLREVVIGLDFSMFNTHLRYGQDFEEERLLVAADGSRTSGRPLEPVAVSLSMDALVASVRTVWKNRNGAFGTVCGADGRCWMRREREWVIVEKGVRRMFGRFEKGFLGLFWFPPPAREFRFDDPATGRTTFDELRQILRLANARELDLRLLISPSHVRLSETRIAAGLGEVFEEWKRTLVQLLAEESPDVPLWDFSGYHPLTAEEFPESDDPGAMLRWHMDPSHYRKELGDLVLDRVLRHDEPGREVPADFGTLLTPENVGEVIERWRRDHARYRETHEAAVSQIEEWARRATAARRIERSRQAER